MTSFPAQLRGTIRHTIGHTKLVPGLYRALDYPDVAALAMPGALLVINGSRDALFEPDGRAGELREARACYAKAGVPEKLRTRLYDTPHEFNAEMQAEAWEWLGRHRGRRRQKGHGRTERKNGTTDREGVPARCL